jgi:ABC-type transport system involved in cytochrome bd biosynthesis fused ATPase/permease subunit
MSVPGGAAEAGQASVELVALAPLIVVVVLAAAQLLAAGAARELADHAAEAGAIALLQEADPEVAAREATPGWSRGRLLVHVEQRRVRVRLRPRSFVPGLAGLLETTGEAHAGPSPPSRAR